VQSNHAMHVTIRWLERVVNPPIGNRSHTARAAAESKIPTAKEKKAAATVAFVVYEDQCGASAGEESEQRDPKIGEPA